MERSQDIRSTVSDDGTTLMLQVADGADNRSAVLLDKKTVRDLINGLRRDYDKMLDIDQKEND